MHITKKELIKNKDKEKYDLTEILWRDDIIKVDSGFKYTFVKGKSPWNSKDANIYTGKDTITSIIEFYKMKELAEYLKTIKG